MNLQFERLEINLITSNEPKKFENGWLSVTNDYLVIDLNGETNCINKDLVEDFTYKEKQDQKMFYQFTGQNNELNT